MSAISNEAERDTVDERDAVAKEFAERNKKMVAYAKKHKVRYYPVYLTSRVMRLYLETLGYKLIEVREGMQYPGVCMDRAHLLISWQHL